MRKLALVIVLLTWVVPARATVVTTGDVAPGGTGTQPDPWNVGESLAVGNSDTGTLNIESGGEVSNTTGLLGLQSGSTGSATVSGTGSTWTNSSWLSVGFMGSGTLNVESGGEVFSTEGLLGLQTGSTGMATVSGTSSKWTNSDSLYIGGGNLGSGGSGTLNLHESGEVAATNTVKLWSTGTINLDGGILTTGSFDNSESGTLNFDDGTLTVSGVGGSFDPGTADLKIDGMISTDLPELVIAGTAHATLSGDTIVGSSQQGKLVVDSGGVVSNTTGYIGRYSGSTGIATITGAGSKWTNSGPLEVGRFGDGTLNITSGGLVEVAGATSVAKYADSKGFIHFDNGTLSTGGLISSLEDLSGTGTIHTHGLISDVDLVFDATHGLVQSFALANPGQNISVHLDVNGVGRMGAGHSSSGTLQIADGVTVSSPSGYVGYKAGSTGIATVTGENSKWTNSQWLVVGNKGNGTLNVESGGEVSSYNGSIGSTYGSTGVATVSGAGSKWTNSNALTVGSAGNGTLNIEDGGEVLNFYSRIGVAYNPSGVGTVTVSGAGSKWINSSFLTVGHTGKGTLIVEDGGEVYSSEGTIADWELVCPLCDEGYFDYLTNVNGQGTVTVSGEGSKWINSGKLSVGDHGWGILNIKGGGLVSNTIGVISEIYSSTGMVTVSGAGSKWINSGLLTVGDNGDGTLIVEAGGEVSSVNGAISDVVELCPYLGTTFFGCDFRDLKGAVTITGAGSKWTNSGSLIVGGPEADATLNIESGGQVSNTSGLIAYESDSKATVTITGSDSVWSNDGDLFIGGNGSVAGGTATVTVGSGGTLSVAGDTTIYSAAALTIGDATLNTSILNLDGGTFTAPDLSGMNTLQFNAGSLSVTGQAGLAIDAAGPLGALELHAGDALNVEHTLTVASGVTVTVSAAVVEVGGLAGAGNLTFETGTYALGKISNNVGIALAGTLGVGPANLSLVDADGVDLGSTTTLAGGTLGSLTGFALDSGDAISGHGDLFGDLDLGSDGTVAGSGTGLSIYGDVSGSGDISNTTIYGNIDVGSSAGQLALTDVVLSSAGTLSLEIGGPDWQQYDRVTLNGTTALAGNLEVSLIDGFLPQVGDTYGLFSLAPRLNLQGGFNSLVLPDLEAISWDTSSLLTSGSLLAIADPCALGGDASCDTDDLNALIAALNTTDVLFDLTSDGVVDVADLDEWLSLAATENGYSSPYLRGDLHLDRDVDLSDYNMLTLYFNPSGTYGPYLWDHANFDGDNDVDLADYNALASNFSPAGYGAAAVPEPAAALLALLGMLLFSACRRLSVLS